MQFLLHEITIEETEKTFKENNHYERKD